MEYILGLNRMHMIKDKWNTLDDMKAWEVSALLCLFVLNIPFLLWPVQLKTIDPRLITIRVLCNVLSIFFVFREILPSKKARSLLWGLNLFFCFVGLPFYVLLVGGFKVSWFFHGVLCMILLGVITTFLPYVVMLCAYLLGNAFLYHIQDKMDHPIFADINIGIYGVFFFVFFVLILLRNREYHFNEQHKLMSAVSSSLAHDIRTPLCQISLEVEGLADCYDKKRLEVIKSAVIRAAHLVDVFLGYFTNRHQKIELEGLDVGKVLLNAIESNFHPEDIKNYVSYDISGNMHILANAFFLNQVFVNIVKNALFYIKKNHRGTIVIKSYNAHKGCFIEIKDTAEGIQEKNISRIFDVFYTTRKEGSGVGLAFVKLVLKKMGAEIFCDSIYGEYTKFTIFFSQKEAP